MWNIDHKRDLRMFGVPKLLKEDIRHLILTVVSTPHVNMPTTGICVSQSHWHQS